MSPFIRKVKTASGATAVQLARRVNGRDKIIKHLGSAHTDQELAVLLEIARQQLDPGQGEFDLALPLEPPPEQTQTLSRTDGAVVTGHASRLLWDCLQPDLDLCLGVGEWLPRKHAEVVPVSVDFDTLNRRVVSLVCPRSSGK